MRKNRNISEIFCMAALCLFYFCYGVLSVPWLFLSYGLLVNLKDDEAYSNPEGFGQMQLLGGAGLAVWVIIILFIAGCHWKNKSKLLLAMLTILAGMSLCLVYVLFVR